MKLGAIVLCGGDSRRMGHPKAWLSFGPERLLQRVVRLVGTAAEPVVVVAAPEQDLPALPAEIAVARDPVAGRGPLQGLAAGFASLPHGVEFVYATATDVPFLEPRWVTRLAELIGDHDLAIPFVDRQYHPLAALYRREAALPAIQRLLCEDRLRLKGVVEQLRTRAVTEEDLRPIDPRLQTLRNLNDPGEYQQALMDAGLTDG